MYSCIDKISPTTCSFPPEKLPLEKCLQNHLNFTDQIEKTLDMCALLLNEGVQNIFDYSKRLWSQYSHLQRDCQLCLKKYTCLCLHQEKQRAVLWRHIHDVIKYSCYAVTSFYALLHSNRLFTRAEGAGNGTVVSVSVYQAGGPGSLPAQSACFRKVRFYHCVINSFPPVPTTGSKKGRPCVIMSV